MCVHPASRLSDKHNTRGRTCSQAKYLEHEHSTSAKANPDWIWIPVSGSGCLLKFNGDLLPCPKLHLWWNFRKKKIRSIFFSDISQIVEKCPVSTCWEILEKFMDPDTNAYNFQKLISSSLSTGTCLVKLSWRSGQLTDKQTKRRELPTVMFSNKFNNGNNRAKNQWFLYDFVNNRRQRHYVFLLSVRPSVVRPLTAILRVAMYLVEGFRWNLLQILIMCVDTAEKVLAKGQRSRSR